MEEKFTDKFDEVGAMWDKENGGFSMKLDGMNYLVLPNKFKDKGENRPSYRIYKGK